LILKIAKYDCLTGSVGPRCITFKIWQFFLGTIQFFNTQKCRPLPSWIWIYWLAGSRGPRHIVMPHFDTLVNLIRRYWFYFSRWRCPHSLICLGCI